MMFFRYRKIPVEKVHPSDKTAASESVKYGLLKRDSQLNWVIQKEPDDNESIMVIPDADKKYAFVMMPNNEIRIISVDNNDYLPHLEISQHAHRILYAGEVFFDFDEDDKPVISRWNNHSPVYSSSPDLISQTGLPEDRFTSSSTNSKIFA